MRPLVVQQPGSQPQAVTGRFRLASARTAKLAGIATLVLLAVNLPLVALAHQFTFSNLSLGIWVGLPYAIVGTIVARRQPRNPVGWLLLAGAFFAALCSDAGMYSVLRYRIGDTSLPLGPLAAFLAPSWMPLVVLLPLPIALFPDGRMPSRRWRATLWAYAIWAVLWLSTLIALQVDGLIVRPIRVDTSGATIILSHPPPTGVWNTLFAFSNVLLLGYLALSLAWVGRQIAAYRRATGERHGNANLHFAILGHGGRPKDARG